MLSISIVVILSEKYSEPSQPTVSSPSDKESLIALVNTISRGTASLSFVGEEGCAWKEAFACVNSNDPSYIKVKEKTLEKSLSPSEWLNLLTHEYAHTVQFRNEKELISNLPLFDNDIELMADCMAMSRIGKTYKSGYKNSCSLEQVAVASKSWGYN